MIAANLGRAACDDSGERVCPKLQCGALLRNVFTTIVDAFRDAAFAHDSNADDKQGSSWQSSSHTHGGGYQFLAL